MTTRRRSHRLLATLAATTLLAAACAGSDSATVDDSVETGDTEAADGDAPADGEEPESSADGEEPDPVDDAASDEAPSGDGAAVGEIGGSGCGTPHGPYEEGAEPAGEVRVAWNQAAYSFNTDTNRGNATANANPQYLMNASADGSGFIYYDADLVLINNDQFGTCTIDSLDPLTVTYTINEGVTWNDGVQVDAADMLMTWAAQSGVYNDAETVVTDTGVTAQADENGAPVISGPDGDVTSAEEGAYDAAFDPETGELLDGFTYAEASGVSFDSASESLQLVTQFPEISDDGLSLTATWDNFFVDFALGGPFPGVPAHVVAQRALEIEDPTEAKAALIDALETSSDEVKPISDVWNRDFDATSLPDDPGLYASFGPYDLVDFSDDGTMVFEAREDYAWGPRPNVQTIVYSIIGDPTAAVQAMANEEIDVIYPQATSDILTQLDGIADRGIEVIQGDGPTYEHVDFAVANGGPFDPATYGGDEEIARAVRQAFLLAVPRQDIVDRLIIPLNENAEVRNSLTQVPGSPFYDEMVASNGSDFYADVDIEQAQQILADAGVETPIDVRNLFADDNPRRASTYELLRDSVGQAGFNLIDGRDINWGSNLANPSIYDVVFFGWQSTTVDVAGTQANFVTGGQNNFYGYSNETVDSLYDELVTTTDPDTQNDLLLQIESELFADAFGLPIYQFPAVTAYNSTFVDNVDAISLAPTVLYNFWEWTAA